MTLPLAGMSRKSSQAARRLAGSPPVAYGVTIDVQVERRGDDHLDGLSIHKMHREPSSQ
ncbi:hypothetical protein EXIGLDRAFT_733281 [Exidia glandulosa HHB12029]|uniref:Uncharacterized protein n=1 Tax=Exidia glandulosa HHB12029 TaxID=1314781 RepID=A0A165BC43_EXIGL|nr:hypothetical protein EXIGLDRAFT_733281 [Exidia glandulosa HHB12029]